MLCWIKRHALFQNQPVNFRNVENTFFPMDHFLMNCLLELPSEEKKSFKTMKTHHAVGQWDLTLTLIVWLKNKLIKYLKNGEQIYKRIER